MIDWESIREECLYSGDKIEIPKEDVLPFLSNFHETHLGISKRAIRQYRDNKPTNSLHLHEYSDHFSVHVDAFNPEYHPLAHGVVDAPGVALGIVAGAVVCFLIANSIKNLSFLPSDHDHVE